MAVNVDSGEIELSSRLDDAKYVLRFGPNDLAKVEEALHKDLAEIINDMSRLSIRTCRALIKLTLVQPKGAKVLTDEQAGNLLNAVGYKQLMDAVAQGVGWMKAGTELADDTQNPTEPSGESSA